MGQQKVKDLKEEPKEKPKRALKPSEKKETVKKWKGKDWYAILAPKMFRESLLAETPCINPKTLIGRTVSINLAELINQESKYYMNMKFKIDRVEGKNAYTRFNGYHTAKDRLFRVVRKKLQKVRTMDTINTKDNWKIQITMTTILNRNTDAKVQKKVRKSIEDFLKKNGEKSTVDDIIRSVISGSIQKNIKKFGSKIYPVRFTEVEKIEVIKPGPLEGVEKSSHSV